MELTKDEIIMIKRMKLIENENNLYNMRDSILFLICEYSQKNDDSTKIFLEKKLQINFEQIYKNKCEINNLSHYDNEYFFSKNEFYEKLQSYDKDRMYTHTKSMICYQQIDNYNNYSFFDKLKNKLNCFKKV